MVTANALNALNNNLGRLIGPAIGSVLFAAGGLPAVVIADAVTFAASAVSIAGALVARVANQAPARLLFAGGLIGLVLTDLGMANAAWLAPPDPPAIVAAAFMVIAGVPVVAANAAGAGLLQTLNSDAYRGRVFGALGTTEGIATLAGLLLGGPLADAIAVAPAVSAGATMWVAGGVVALLRLPRDPTAEPPRDTQ